MNELVVQGDQNDLAVSRAPRIILEEAKIAATALRDVISKKDKPVKFNGEQYLEFEDWQTIAKFYGLVCSTMDPVEVTIDGVIGAKARAEVVDVKTGHIVGQASAWCLRDEPNWKIKPFYQLGSMAQTRAGSKALRNLLSWVVVLAGYKTTPAEEIQGEMVNDAIDPGHSIGSHGGVLGADTDPVHDILDKLVAMHQGDQVAVEEHLKFITRYTSKEGKDTWLKISDLENVARRKPEWIERIHQRVVAAFEKSKAH